MTVADDLLTGKVQVPLEDALKVHGEADVVFFDGSWWMPNSNKNARQAYEQGPRIAGAKLFDVDDVASTGEERNPKNLPHMVSSFCWDE